MIDGEYSVSGWNRYMYCGGNPVIYRDPTGHEMRGGVETGAYNGHSGADEALTKKETHEKFISDFQKAGEKVGINFRSYKLKDLQKLKPILAKMGYKGYSKNSKADPSAQNIQLAFAAKEIQIRLETGDYLPQHLLSNSQIRMPALSLPGVKSTFKNSVYKLKVNVKVKFKNNWSKSQIRAAKSKVKSLNKSNLVVTRNYKRKGNTRARYKRSGKHVSNSEDVDHIVDLQLGGADDLKNMKNLDSSVNRSIGKQLQNSIKNLKSGTVVNKVYYK